MPVAVESWDDLVENYTTTTPLKVLNMGPDFVHDRNVLDSKTKRIGRRPMVKESGYSDDMFGSEDPRNMRSRGKHKERNEFTRGMNKTQRGDRNQLFDKTNQQSDNRSETDSESAKLSVRARVQLLNNQPAGESDGIIRGRSKVTRGWMKKRDQSAPPVGTRNRVFQNQNSVSEKNSPSRRSRSIERSGGRHSDQYQNVEPCIVRGHQQRDLPKSEKFSLSKNYAFIEVGKPRMFDQGDKNMHTEKSTVISHSNTPPYINPRSRTRNGTTSKTSKSIKRNSPNSLHQEESGVEVTSESSSEKVAVCNKEQTSGISVKRMVSFIHKGGLTDENVTKRQVQKHDREDITDSGSPSIHSSSQVDILPAVRQTPEYMLTSSVISSIDLESFKTDDKGNVQREEDVRHTTSLVKSKDTRQCSVEPEKTSSKPDYVDGLNLNYEAQRTSTLLPLRNSPNDPAEVQSSYMKSDEQESVKPVNINSIVGEDSVFSQGQRQVYNLHYKSDSSSSQYKSDDNNRLTNGRYDPEWDDIVARSYAVDLLSSASKPQHSNANDSSGDTTDGSAVKTHRPPNVHTSVSKSSTIEGEIDVFKKSMQPLDFALAIRSITEVSKPVRSSDQSFDGTNSPHDGIVFARRVHVRDEIDGPHPIQSEKHEDEDDTDDVFIPQERNDTCKDNNENTIRGRESGMTGSVGSRSPRRKESYSTLTTVHLKSDGSVGNAKDVSSSLNVSVEVDVDSDEDYVKLNPSYKTPLNPPATEMYGLKGTEESRLKPCSPNSYKAHLGPSAAEMLGLRGLDENKVDQSEHKYFSSTPRSYPPHINTEMLALSRPDESRVDQSEQKTFSSIPNSYRPPLDPPDAEVLAIKWLDESKVYKNEQKTFSSTHMSYRPPLDPSDADMLAMKRLDMSKVNQSEQKLSSYTPSTIAKLKAKSQNDVHPTSFEVVKPKLSASPEFRRHRLKLGHYKMPSKSSIASTGSVSYHPSSQGSSSNDAGGQRKSRKSSVLSPTLNGRRSNPPPNDITVFDPHSSMESTNTPRLQSNISKPQLNTPRTQLNTPRTQSSTPRPHSSATRPLSSSPRPLSSSPRPHSKTPGSRSKSKYARSNSEVSSSSSSSSQQSQLNHFFDMMGLESSVLSSVLQPVPYDDDSIFQDMHTWKVGSSTNSSHSGSFSEGSRVSADGVMNIKKLTKLPDQSQSIITKNARVIKWLVQCKKSNNVAR